MSNIVNENNRYKSNVKDVTWNVSELTKEEKIKIRKRLVVGLIHSEEEYRALLSYFHMKYPDLMDIYKNDGKRFQWRYQSYPEKIQVFDKVSKKKFDMYGLVYYDKERDMEPIAVGGSYFRRMGAIRDPFTHQVIAGQKVNKHTTTIRAGRGYRLFIDPSYRRLGLAKFQWLTEAQLYRDCDIQFQRERQTYDALMVTRDMFDDPNKCYLLERRNLNLLRENETVKCVMDYNDKSLIKNFKKMPENLKDFRNEADWRFLERENLTIEELTKPWKEKGR